MKKRKLRVTSKMATIFICIILVLCSCNTYTLQNGNYGTEEVSVTSTVTSAQSSKAQGSEKQNSSKIKKTSSNSKTTSEAEIDFELSGVKITPILNDNYYYTARLNNAELAAYRTLKTAVATRTVGYINLGNITEQQARLVYTAVKNDYPEYFWIPNSYSYNRTNSGDLILAMETDDPDSKIRYLVSSAERITMAVKLKKVISEIKADLEKIATKNGSTVYDLEEYIYNWLAKNVEYYDSKDKNDLVYTAYGALVEKKAVCEGYSRAAMLMLNLAGIENCLVSGKGTDGIGHMWNMVKLDGNWYHLDTTWADDPSYPNNPYPFFFNLSDNEITRDRTINPNLESDYSNYGENFNYNIPTCPKSGRTYSAKNYIQLELSQNPQEKIISSLGNYLIQNQTAGTALFDVSISSKETKSDACKFALEVNFKNLISTVNRDYLLHTKIKIKEYTISMVENGAFRMILTVVNA